MKLVRWKRFIWELSKLPPYEYKLPTPYVFRAAAREELKAVTNVVITAFSLDSAWSDTLNLFRERLEIQIEQAFARESVPALVVTHGPRIIAASVISTEVDSDSHLVSGPCVFSEYCNRGMGTALLHQTLVQLRVAGLERAAVVTKVNTPACKFVFTKFDSTGASYDLKPYVPVES
jgi:hypothetical protein